VTKILNLAHINAGGPRTFVSGAPGIRDFRATVTNVGAPTGQGRAFPDATSWTYRAHPPGMTTLPMGLTSVDKRGAPHLRIGAYHQTAGPQHPQDPAR